MKLVHVADLHLGYRAYHRTNAQGVNVREADVARAFRETLDRSIELEPDLVLIAGDVFHTVRPSNAAIADAFRQFARFAGALDGVPVVIIAGNHDSPRAAETGNILRLFGEIPGITVVYNAARRLLFPELDAAVLCLPHNALLAEALPSIEPEPAASTNILLAHGFHEHLKLVTDVGAAVLRADDIDPDDWTYVALGHYHLYEKLAPNMIYAGGIERTSLNIWAEAERAKGFVEFDCEAGRARFQELESPRPVIDLPPIAAAGFSPSEVDAAIESSLGQIPGGLSGKIIRLRVFDLPREIYRELDHRRIRAHRTEALHFHLDARQPQIVRREGQAAPGRRLTLEEELVAFLRQRWNAPAGDVDRDALAELGLHYLKQTEEEAALEDA